MSGELTKARQKLAGINASLKMGKYMTAAQALNDAIVLMLSAPLLKNEREEFAQMLDTAVYSLNNHKELRKFYPLLLHYTPGAEKKLLEELYEMRKVLQEDVNETAQKDLEALESKKREGLERGQKHLDEQQFDEARQAFDRLTGEFPGDAELKADIADRYYKAGLNQDAVGHLSQAINESPESIHLYNRIGIVLRKMQDFESAEGYYRRALGICQTDEYLFFNLGRLYYDWQKWAKMAEAAKMAVAINPNFVEAKKLLAFAQKKLGG
ncbi:Tetratricopeptide repeat-containing protein [Humidesulfovibrio mexicanus]|uniref:Tetratricopeptide repeat-containing protein n=1 Tax=Humidesulfovibrio mexicanus TaxID=147047 RepID=A0A239BFZ2_9BACT|nr:tetratricopeptide repeat protein [Humidesulfovibrio mexicanus]SNS06411.1 Tetratricopeptide repeat-containing protein [Humidesulfovibrio mexicanus]